MVQTGQQLPSLVSHEKPERQKQSNERHSAQDHDQQKVGILAALKSVDDFLSLSHGCWMQLTSKVRYENTSDI
jgi:hypothetical protein